MGGLSAVSPVPKHKGADKHLSRSKTKEQKTLVRQDSPSNGLISAISHKSVSGTSHHSKSAASESTSTDLSRKLGAAEDVTQSVNSPVANMEYDSVSTNGSCSGESEDQPQSLNKEKCRIEPPGSVGPFDKREKIRARNGKKHQRQKERRAKELLDRSIGYIMSYKLKVLTGQLVGMGFSLELAEKALVLNHGHVENSIACLLEGREELLEKDCGSQTELKLDISEELKKITDFETDCGACSRAEIDKAIVACEGDIDKAFEQLRDRLLHKPPVGHPDPSCLTVKLDQTDELEEQMLAALSCTVSGGLAHSEDMGKPQVQTNAYKEESVNVADKFSGQFIASASTIQSESSSETFSNKMMLSGDGREISDGFRTSLNIFQPGTLSMAPPQLRTGYNSLESGRSFWSSLRDASILQASSGQRLTQQSFHKQDAIHSQAGISSYLTDSLKPFHREFRSSASAADSHIYGECNRNLVDGRGISGKGADYNHNVENVNLAEAIWPSYLAYTIAVGRMSSQSVLDTFKLPFSSSSFTCTSSPGRSPTNVSSELWTGWGSGAPLDWSLQSVRNRDYRSVDWSMSATPASWETAFHVSESSLQISSNPILDLTPPSQGICDHSVRNPPRTAAMADTYDLWGTSKFNDTCTPLGVVEDSTHDIANSLPGGVQEWTSPFAGKDLFTLPRQAIPSTL